MAKPLLYDGLLSASHQSIITGDSARSSSFTLLEGDPIFPNQSYYTVSAINEACFARTYSTAYGEGSPMAFVSPPNSRGQSLLSYPSSGLPLGQGGVRNRGVPGDELVAHQAVSRTVRKVFHATKIHTYRATLITRLGVFVVRGTNKSHCFLLCFF